MKQFAVLRPTALALLVTGALWGCTWEEPYQGRIQNTEIEDQQQEAQAEGQARRGDAPPEGESRLLFGEKGVLGSDDGGVFDDPSDGGVLKANQYLWRAALDTVSFMPIQLADAFNGVLLSDWYAPPETPDERFKINVFVLSQQLRSDGVRVSLFREVRGPDGTWTTAEVAANTNRDIENSILTRARELRLQARSSS